MTPSKDRKTARLICVLGILLLPGVSQARTIVGLTVGDSITQGLVRDFFGNVGGVTSPQSGSKNFGGYQPPAVSQFNADNADTLELYNWGVAGALSVEGIDRTRTALASRNADVIFIEYGANDAYAFIGSSSTVFNIQVMAEEAIDDGVLPLIGTVTPNTGTECCHFSNSQIEAGYNVRIRDMAASLVVPVPEGFYDRPLKNPTGPAPVADHWTEMNPNWGAYTSGDGLHLGSAGNSKMGSVWVDALEEYIASIEFLIVPVPEYLLLLLDD